MTKLSDQRTAAFSNFQKQPASQQPALSSSYRVTRESFIPSAQLLFVHVPNTHPFHQTLSRKLHECLCTKLQPAKKLPFSPHSAHLALELPLGEILVTSICTHPPLYIPSSSRWACTLSLTQQLTRCTSKLLFQLHAAGMRVFTMTRRRGETDAGKFRINGKGTGLGVCVKRGIVSARGVIPLSDSAPRLFVRGKRKGLSATCAACVLACTRHTESVLNAATSLVFPSKNEWRNEPPFRRVLFVAGESAQKKPAIFTCSYPRRNSNFVVPSLGLHS